MESYKDVLVSQPPAMYSQAAYTTNISVENYKGILLCERPTNFGTSSMYGGDDGSGKPSFSPASPTGNPTGLGPSKESLQLRAEHTEMRETNQRRQRQRTCQALSRHRRWLRSFAKQVKEMKEGDIQREVEAAQRAARLRAAERAKREETQAAAPCCSCRESPVAEAYDSRKEMAQHVDTVRAKAAASAPSAKASQKPKWAMTEDEALDDEFEIDRDLLDFAENLDYERFITDYEVAEALAVMRNRVADIAKEHNWTAEDVRRAAEEEDDDDEQGGEGATAAGGPLPPQSSPGARPAAPGGAVQHNEAWDASSGRGRVLKSAISRDALALADRLFAASPSLQKTHTRQSLARLLQRCALEGNVSVERITALVGGGAAARPESLAIAEPKVVRVGAEAVPGVTAAGEETAAQPTRILRELQTSKERTQGLAYLYRCPAI